MRVLFHVQHLLGVGHLRRGELIVKALVERGIEVTVALGGMPVAEMPFAGADVVQLPPTKIAGADFKVLYDADGAPITDAWRAARRDALLAVYEDVKPDVVLLEMFPFGRWRFNFELVPLLERAASDKPRVKCVTSVRDILVETKHPERARRGAEIAKNWLDAVLVHSDPSLFTFEETYPHAAEIAGLVGYTGYVTEPAQRGAIEANGKVVISAGGGAAAGQLMQAALAARPLCAPDLRERIWHFLTGPRFAEDEFRDLVARADDRTIVERFSTRFQSLLDGAAASISQAGYNTVMNLMRAKIPAVVVPYDEAEETEQWFRSERMAKMGLLSMVKAGELSGETLAAALTRAFEQTSAPHREGAQMPSIDLDGARKTAAMIEQLAGNSAR